MNRRARRANHNARSGFREGHSGETQSTNWSLERSKSFGLMSWVLTDSIHVYHHLRGSIGRQPKRGWAVLPSAPWKSTAFGFVAATNSCESLLLVHAQLLLRCQAVLGLQSLRYENNSCACLCASAVSLHHRYVTNLCPHVCPSSSKVGDTGRRRQCQLWGQRGGSSGCWKR